MIAGIACCDSVWEKISFLKLIGRNRRKEILSEARVIILAFKLGTWRTHIWLNFLCITVFRNLILQKENHTTKFKFDEASLPRRSHQKVQVFSFSMPLVTAFIGTYGYLVFVKHSCLVGYELGGCLHRITSWRAAFVFHWSLSVTGGWHMIDYHSSAQLRKYI